MSPSSKFLIGEKINLGENYFISHIQSDCNVVNKRLAMCHSHDGKRQIGFCSFNAEETASPFYLSAENKIGVFMNTANLNLQEWQKFDREIKNDCIVSFSGMISQSDKIIEFPSKGFKAQYLVDFARFC